MGFKSVRYGYGRGSIELTGDMRGFFLGAARAAASSMVDNFEEITTELERNAQKDWPVRQKRYGRSENSRDKFKTGLRIIPPNKIQAFVSNYSPYAWAIFSAVETRSDTTVKPGKKVADVLLWAPAKKQTEKLIESIAAEFVKKAKT